MMQTNHQLPRLRKQLPTLVNDDTAAHQGKFHVLLSQIKKQEMEQNRSWV